MSSFKCMLSGTFSGCNCQFVYVENRSEMWKIFVLSKLVSTEGA